MRIPLDYYRILGLPVQTGAEQLQQAYRDRTLQLPRREYSAAAIEARKRIIEQAYQVLSQPEQRAQYDASYFAHTYEREANRVAESPPEKPLQTLPAADPYTPSIEIADDLLVGALLILQELGEYELVLNLGQPHLSRINIAAEAGEKPEAIASDMTLTVALACLELGREQWQQGQYENAAGSLEAGKNLLLPLGLFPHIASEIQAELDKLRPYRILELLSRPENHLSERRQGLKLLQEILQQRGGIDGTADDGSGLSVDDFLRFVQQLRSYLTVSEQQSLFAAESQRPSSVASYLQVYALIARGFAQRMPVLVRQAQLLLLRLGKRQDLYLEQAVCSLLLGQTAAATQALEFSREYEAIAFIREHSQAAPDLLPGLCLYSERWLQTEVFPHFRDLAEQQASLKTYFADEQVQAYLDALPTQLEATDEWVAAQLPNSGSQSKEHNSSSTKQQWIQEEPVNTADVESDLLPLSTSTASAATSVALVPTIHQRSQATSSRQNLAATTDTMPTPTRSRRRPRQRRARIWDSPSRDTQIARRHNNSTRSRGRSPRARKNRLALLLFTGVMGVLLLGFLLSQAYGLIRQTLIPASTLQGEQLLVQLDQPPIAIPDPQSQALSKPEPLNQATAMQVIQTWLATKSEAFGRDRAIAKLDQILVAPTLLQWQQRAQKDKADNRYRQFKHNLKVNAVRSQPGSIDQAQVEASVREVAQIYENGRLNQSSSYDETINIRYDLVRKDGQWRIREMTILK